MAQKVDDKNPSVKRGNKYVAYWGGGEGVWED